MPVTAANQRANLPTTVTPPLPKGPPHTPAQAQFSEDCRSNAAMRLSVKSGLANERAARIHLFTVAGASVTQWQALSSGIESNGSPSSPSC